MGSRTYAQREWKLLSWWLATYHANADEILMNVRVGPTVIPTIAGMPAALPATARLINRWADAIFVENGAVTIVEAKLDPDPGIFSQLLHYARKFRMDPGFAQYASAPLNLVALVYNDDPSVSIEAPWYGVTWVVYQPTMNDFVPPQLKGTFADSVGSLLPQDWPARVNLLTGKKLALGG
jgi:hypothetical protein